MLFYYDHNHLTIMPHMHPPLLEIQAKIPIKDEPTIMNSSLRRNLGEFMSYKSTSALNIKYQKRKFVLITDKEHVLLVESKHLFSR